MPAIALAAYNTVTHSSDVLIYIADREHSYTLASTSEVESYTVGVGSVDFVVGDGSSLKLSYAGKIKFVASSHNCTETNVECNSSESYVSLNCSGISGTPSISVSTILCGSGVSGDTGGGGGGGGGADLIAPAISGVAATVTDTQATISWSTNEASLTWLLYGTTSAYGSEKKTTAYATAHSVTFTGLTSGTTYHYQVKSKDATGNVSSYTDKTFTTTGTQTTPTTPTTPTTEIKAGTATPTTGTAVKVSCALEKGGAYKIANSPAVYYITSDCAKRPFSKSNVFFTYFDSWKDVKTASKATIDSLAKDTLGFMPWGPKYDPKYGALVKIVTDPKVYLLLGTERYWITAEDVFEGLGYSWNWIEDIDKALLDKYTTGSEIGYKDHHPNYTLVKYAGSPKVYRLEPNPTDSTKQVRRWIPDEKAFNKLNFRWDRIVIVKDTEVYTEGAKLEN